MREKIFILVVSMSFGLIILGSFLTLRNHPVRCNFYDYSRMAIFLPRARCWSLTLPRKSFHAEYIAAVSKSTSSNELKSLGLHIAVYTANFAIL